VHRDIQGPVFDMIVEMIHDIEEGRRTCEVANLDELARRVAALPGETADRAARSV
jgi:2-dehydropantoate 2-reductase